MRNQNELTKKEKHPKRRTIIQLSSNKEMRGTKTKDRNQHTNTLIDKEQPKKKQQKREEPSDRRTMNGGADKEGEAVISNNKK